MKTKLPAAITTVRQAKMLLKKLHTNGESFHPEDDANDLVGELFTKEEGDQLNKLMEDIYNLPGNDGKHDSSIAFCPCGYLLDLDLPKKSFYWSDKTGRGMSSKATLSGIVKYADDNEVNWDGLQLAEWAREAEEGDEWENSTDKYICTEG